MKNRKVLLLVWFLFLAQPVLARDTQVWQGQYYTGHTLNEGTYTFNFTVYDDSVGGNACYTNQSTLTTNYWGWWKTEQKAGASCTNSSEDYFLEITIGGVLQKDINGSVRRRLTLWDYLRRDVEDTKTGDFILDGTMFGSSPLKLEDVVSFVNATKDAQFSIYHAQSGVSIVNVSSDFYGSLILETVFKNPYQMEVCFWDKDDQKMIMCLNEGAIKRATTVRRSFQIIGNKTDKLSDENFTLCEGMNYIDCSTDITGADLFVQDDIEAQSIYANENITAMNFLGKWNGSKNLVSSVNITNKNIGVFNISANVISADLIQAPLGKFTNITSDKINADLLETYSVESTNVSATDIFIDNIIFGFGQIIDNIVNGWIRLIGNLNVTGNFTGNQFYGFTNITNASELITISTQDVWYNITNFSINNANGFSPATYGIKVNEAGTYLINFDSTFICTANTQYEYAISVNYLPKIQCKSSASVGVQNERENIAGNCILSLNLNDTIGMMVRNIDSTANPTIKEAHITLLRVGD